MEEDLNLGERPDDIDNAEIDTFGYSDYIMSAFTALSSLELIDKGMHKGAGEIERNCFYILKRSIAGLRKILDSD